MDWKQRLYDNYVTSGQSGTTVSGPAPGLAASPYFRQRLLPLLPVDRNAVIGDLGCGAGTVLNCCRELGYTSLSGVDASPEQVSLARSRGMPFVECATIKQFLLERVGKFDLLFMLDVLEHVEKAELLSLLEAVRGSLKPEGLLVLHVPNAAGLFGMRIQYGDLTHVSAFTQRSMRQLLAVAGFSNTRFFEDGPCVYSGSSFARSLLWRVLMLPLRLLLIAETGQRGEILSQCMLILTTRDETR